MIAHRLDSDIPGAVDAYLHDLLPEKDRAYVEQRTRESGVWRAAMQEAERRMALLRAAPATEPPERLIERSLHRAQREGARRERLRARVVWSAGLAAAAALALFIGAHLYFAGLSPSPYDLQIIGQDDLLSGSRASLRIRLSRHDSGAGVAGVPVNITLRDPDGGSIRLASFSTDDVGSGSPHIELPDWADGRYELAISARTSRGMERIVSPVELRRQWRVLLSSDKPVYQPGQVIRMRTIALRAADGRPTAGEPAEFEVADAAGNLIFREKTVTSEFGIASADCPLADLITEGAYTLRCRVGAVQESRTVDVRRYTLPKFRARLSLSAAFYAPGDTLSGAIDAAYYFGKPVAGVAEIELLRESTGEAIDLPVPPVQLDAEGRGRFRVRLPQDLHLTGADGDMPVRVRITVRDSAGQEVQTSTTTVISSQPLRITMVPESGRLVPGIENEIFVFATLPDGTPAQARISVEGLGRDLDTGELGVTSFMLTPAGEDASLAVRATDSSGRTVNTSVDLGVDTSAQAFILRTDATSYDAGEPVQISIFGAGAEPVFIDLVRNGQTVLTDRIEVTGGRGRRALDLPPDLSGALRLVAYRFTSGGWPIQRQRTLLVRPAEQVRVEMEADSADYRPGDAASLTFRLTDDQGAPAPGAISLAIVDEAVFGVGAGVTPLARQLQSIQSELLAPIYTVYPWDPFRADEGEAYRMADRGAGALSARAGTDDRDALLRRLADEGYFPVEMLRVLESERLDEMLDSMSGSISPEALAILRGNGEMYTLREASYPEKERRIKDLKRAWSGVSSAIIGAAVVSALLGLFGWLIWALARASGGWAVVAVLLVLTPLLVGILLPAMGKARQTARQLKAESELRGLGMGIMLASPASEPVRDAMSVASPARVRDWFPETLLWRPEIITDDRGVATLDVQLADSITNWTISGAAVTSAGRLGAIDEDLTVFQPFFVDADVPVALIRADEIELRAIVYNYLDAPQQVSVTLDDADWFELLDEPAKVIPLAPREVASVSFRIRATRLGNHEVTFRATSESAAGDPVQDAVRRQIAVDPEGEQVDRVLSGALRQPATIPIEFPPAAVEGSEQVICKLYPSTFSQVLEGLDGIFRQPHGCFEQTSSTTYPNLLALDYLRRTQTTAPEVEVRAQQYIHLGYQRLLSFEVPGGGFDWFGSPPANATLTAYGLMEFQDMARVRDVDSRLIERTRRWLLGRQQADGSWAPESRQMHDDPVAGDPARARLMTTAYIAWSVFSGDSAPSDAARRAGGFLRQTPPEALRDPYALALVALALRATGDDDAAAPYLDRLAGLRQVDGELAWWTRPAGARTMFYGAGQYGDIEATALCALALLESGGSPALAGSALAWLVEQRSAWGTWGTTQATVLALKALTLGAERPAGGDIRREIEIRLDGQPLRTLVVEPDQSDVMQMIDLTGAMDGPGAITLIDHSGAATAWQIVMRHHELKAPAPEGPLTIDLTYDRRDVRVGEWLGAVATIENTSAQPVPMAILDLPIPAGYAIDTEALDAHVERGAIARYEITPRQAIIYLRQLRPGAPLRLDYRLRALAPGEVQAPGATISEYYNPEVRATSEPAILTSSS
ncbi:MAG: alpha-2-macroglobulin family protein [Phycisphaerales bacterium JB039]